MIERYEKIIKIMNLKLSNEEKLKRIHEVCNHWKVANLKDFVKHNFGTNVLLYQVIERILGRYVEKDKIHKTINGHRDNNRHLSEFLKDIGVK